VLIRGVRAPVVGRICMDLCMVDVTDVPGVQEGDRAILIGRQGLEAIGAAELGALADTIHYEILCALSPRVPRVYRDRDEAPEEVARTRPGSPVPGPPRGR
jgi:alanine racemase